MTNKIDLTAFDLEPRDITVYEQLLLLEDALSIRKVAHAARLNRGTTFEVLKKLTGKGLVAVQYRGKRKQYVAMPPDSLKNYASDVNIRLVQETAKLDEYVRKLESSQKSRTPEQFTQFYEGEEEIAALLRDILDTVAGLQDKTYSVMSSAEISQHLYRKFRNFTKQRIARGIFARVIGIGGITQSAGLAERRWLSTDHVPPCYVIIYGSKVAHISFSGSGQVQGVVIQNSGVAQLHQLLFEQLWDQLEQPGLTTPS